MEDFQVPESCMVIVAHPDDIEFSCAGTLALWANSGTKITYVLCTSGEVGIDDPSISIEEAARIREAEQEEAGGVIGVAEIVFLRESDGKLQATMELRKRLVQEIRRVRPEVIVCWDPTVLWHGSNYINHPDHRAAAEAALDAAFPAAGQPKLFQELEGQGMTAFKPRKIYVSGSEQHDLIVDIDCTMDIKLEALKAHRSQLKGWDPAPMLKKWAEDTAKECEFDYGEAFRVISLESDEDWEEHRGDVLKRL
jgi:LmbE family N-acetylglucosaminyl deacetylase